VLAYERLFVEKTFGPIAMLGLVLVAVFLALVLATWLLFDTRHKESMTAMWMALVSTIGSYLIIDAALGLILIERLSPPLVPDEYRHHKLAPNSFSKLEQRDFSYVQRVNNLGLRGGDTTVTKATGSYRILLLGDSFTMGKGVEDDQTFSVLLERALNQQSALSCNGRVFEVLNGGVDSYAPILSNIQLRRDLAPLRPDLIVHAVDIGDLAQEAAYRSTAVYGTDGEILAVPSRTREESLTERVRNWIDQHLFFTRAGLFYVNRFFGYEDLSVRSVATQANHELVAHTLAEDTKPRDEQWHALFASIGEIADYAHRNDIEHVLTIYPWGHQVNDTEWQPGRYAYMSDKSVASDRSPATIKAMAAERGLHLADSYPVFRTYRGTERLYFRYDNHWTPKGHEVMAQGLFDYLMANHWARWCNHAGAPSPQEGG
jgi:hypothetical protein